MSETLVATIPVSLIRVNGWNPNRMAPAMARQLRANIERTGFVQPILVRHERVDVSTMGGPEETALGGYEIVDGQHRFEAAVELGYTEVPCVIVDVSDADAKAQTMAMNRLRGTMEPADLARLIREVESDGIQLSELAVFSGYSHDELTRTVSLLEFDWRTEPAEDGPARERGPSGEPGESWVTLTYRVPAEVARLVAEQVGRIRRLAGDCPDHMALEAMAALCMAAPDTDFAT